MTPLAAVVMAHRDPAHVRHLIAGLADVPVVLHCDAKAPDAVAREMLRGWGSRVLGAPRTSGALDSWSLVRIELDALRLALGHSDAGHVAVLSGADHPLAGVEELVAALGPWAGRSYLASVSLPFDPWSTPRNPDGGLWRTRHRFLTRGDDVVSVRGVPLRLPWRRPLPRGLELRASAQWKVYAREDVVRLLRVVDERPDIVAFFRSSLVPDESFVASVLGSPQVAGGSPLPDCAGIPWFMAWSQAGDHHPQVLGLEHWEALVEARRQPEGTPASLAAGDAPWPRPWFARKVDSGRSAGLIERIDGSLTAVAPGA